MSEIYLENIRKRFGGLMYTARLMPIFYAALCDRPDVLSWNYIFVFAMKNTTPAWIFGPQIIEQQYSSEEFNILSNIGITSSFFYYPFLALQNFSDVILARMIIGNKIDMIYDIRQDSILLSRQK